MRRRHFLAAVIALVLSVAVPASALAGCIADQSSPAMAQMACCKTAKPDCVASSKGTMECCKTGDHPDQQNVMKVPSVNNPLKVLFVPAVAAQAEILRPFITRTTDEPVPLFAGTTSPPHLAFSALLI